MGFGFSLLYLIPQRFLIAYADEDLKNEIKGGKWYANLWNPEVFSNPAYYLLTLSQCLNAIGFLNLTTFLNIHLSKVMHYTDVKIAGILTTLQVCDMLGRIFVPLLADFFVSKICLHPTCHLLYWSYRDWILHDIFGSNPNRLGMLHHLRCNWNIFLLLHCFMEFPDQSGNKGPQSI